jgi:hypothetical protein
VAGLFGTPSAKAQLKVRNFLFEGGRMGTLSAEAAWNTEKNRIDINAISNDGPDAITYIDGFIAPSKPGEIDLNIRALGTHIDFALGGDSGKLAFVFFTAFGQVRLGFVRLGLDHAFVGHVVAAGHQQDERRETRDERKFFHSNLFHCSTLLIP